MTSPDPDDEDEWKREAAEEEARRLRRAEPPPTLERSEFLAWRAPREGLANPTRLDNPLWAWMVRTGWDAYGANNLLKGPSPFDAGPMWTFDRMGMSENRPGDGRIVHIGGEHEDHYDPDFHIYNDVTVIGPSGDIAIHGYPRAVFPPTDFHSATQVGDGIYIIGGLGYPEDRKQGCTPVHRLCLASMRIEPVATQGDAPGWIHGHTATKQPDGRCIRIEGGELWPGPERVFRENVDAWELDTSSGRWQRLTSRDWQRWVMRRVDGGTNRLWETRHALWDKQHAHLGLESFWRHDDAPDFAALAGLYRFEDCAPPVEGTTMGVFRITVDGVTIRFNERRSWVEAIVEGRIEPARLLQLQRETLAFLERIDKAAYEIEPEDAPEAGP